MPELLAAQGILSNEREDGEWRWVTHKDIERSDLDLAVQKLADILG